MRTPAADRRVLVFIAGIVWSGVGIALISVASWWLHAAGRNVLIPIAAGLIGGAVVFRFGFSRVAADNMARIYRQAPGKSRVCVFAFQNIRGYAIIGVMMALGHFLRHLPLDKIYLAPIYLIIGVGLFLSSLMYYRFLVLGNNQFPERVEPT